MFYILSFLLSWLCGMLLILVTAFYAYSQFSLVDMASFAVFTVGGFVILYLVAYLVVLKIVRKTVTGRRCVFYPLIFSLLANIPAYFVIWNCTPDLYGSGEAYLFTISFVTIGLVFGRLWAWKEMALRAVRKIQGR